MYSQLDRNYFEFRKTSCLLSSSDINESKNLCKLVCTFVNICEIGEGFQLSDDLLHHTLANLLSWRGKLFATLWAMYTSSFPKIRALTVLHFNDDANYQLASYFKSRHTIYYQQGSNSFGGVCLANVRELSHRIAADVFNSNKKCTVAVAYSQPSEKVLIVILNRLHRHNRSLILIVDLNARHPISMT